MSINMALSFKEQGINHSRSFLRNRYPSIHESAIESILRSAGDNHHLIINKEGGAGIFSDFYRDNEYIRSNTLNNENPLQFTYR